MPRPANPLPTIAIRTCSAPRRRRGRGAVVGHQLERVSHDVDPLRRRAGWRARTASARARRPTRYAARATPSRECGAGPTRASRAAANVQNPIIAVGAEVTPGSFVLASRCRSVWSEMNGRTNDRGAGTSGAGIAGVGGRVDRQAHQRVAACAGGSATSSRRAGGSAGWTGRRRAGSPSCGWRRGRRPATRSPSARSRRRRRSAGSSAPSRSPCARGRLSTSRSVTLARVAGAPTGVCSAERDHRGHRDRAGQAGPAQAADLRDLVGAEPCADVRADEAAGERRREAERGDLRQDLRRPRERHPEVRPAPLGREADGADERRRTRRRRRAGAWRRRAARRPRRAAPRRCTAGSARASRRARRRRATAGRA